MATPTPPPVSKPPRVAYVRFEKVPDGAIRYTRWSDGQEDTVLYEGQRVRDALLYYLTKLDPAKVYPITDYEPGTQDVREATLYHRE